LGKYDPFLPAIMKRPRKSRPHRETKASSAERVWQTVTVTSGRIIIGWRVGT
jgi:hypothetical protein